MKQGTVLVKGRRSCHLRKEGGTVLVEVLLAAALLAIILVPVLNFLVTGIETNWFASYEVKAQALAREGLEALRSVREKNWAELADGTFYVTPAAGVWQLVPSEEGETIGPFTRKIQIASVYRDDQESIVETGGWLDPSTKAVAVDVSWRSLRDRVIALTTYLTRYLENLIWRQTTQAEFDLGEKEYVETTQIDDGEVILEGGCPENPEGPLIYDEQFHNTWVIHPSAKNDIREITVAGGQVYEGEKSLELINYSGADTKLRNTSNICTLGFTRFEFYAYNSAGIEQSFGIHGEWGGSFVEITLPPQTWEFVSLAYADISGGNEVNLSFLFFKPFDFQPGTIIYLDNLTLAGGIGGYYLQGTLISSVFDAGRETAFNRIAYQADTSDQTLIGFQVAVANDSEGPWLFYGPEGTTSESDLYTDPVGEGIWLGSNLGRYLRYKAYLFSDDGLTTPTLYEATINYAP